MGFNWLPNLWRQRSSPTKTTQLRRWRPSLERLEDRVTPVSSVTTLGGAVTPATLVQSLVGAGIQISNVTFTGTNVAAGNFTGGATSIGFEQGIILSTGLATDVIGTNTQFASTDNAQPGDADLDAITPNTTEDATVLEFDFLPSGAVLNFQFVFGSEEYPEFVNSGVNDVFAFFLNGQNVALVPNTSTPISIDTLNDTTNSQFYVDNSTGARATKLDAVTTVLTITATVIPDQVNHIKLAISDAGDGIYDSDVFIKAGSFAAPSAPKIKTYNPVRFTGNAKSKIYTGTFTLLNIGNGPATGPFYMIFTKLPDGASIVNATGTSQGGASYITIDKTIKVNKSIKITVKISNPLLKPLNGFFSTNNLSFAATDPAAS